MLEFLESTFVKISKGVFRDTVAAGDGIIFRRMKPDRNDVDGVQAFCDGNCKFVHVSQKVCASSHDGTAYVLTGRSKIIAEGKLNACWTRHTSAPIKNYHLGKEGILPQTTTCSIMICLCIDK